MEMALGPADVGLDLELIASSVGICPPTWVVRPGTPSSPLMAW